MTSVGVFYINATVLNLDIGGDHSTRGHDDLENNCNGFGCINAHISSIVSQNQ